MGGSCRGGGRVRWGGVGHVGVGWGGSFSGGVGHVGVGWGGSCRGGVGWVIVEKMGENNRCYSCLSQKQNDAN